MARQWNDTFENNGGESLGVNTGPRLVSRGGGIYVYDDQGELDPLGRTMWLRVGFGMGWAVHGVARVGMAPDSRLVGLVLYNSGQAMPESADRTQRLKTFESIDPGDRVVRVCGHGLVPGAAYLCFDIELHLASGRVLSAVGEHRAWKGAAFSFVCPPGHAIMSIRIAGGTCEGLNVMRTSLFEPWVPREHRYLKARPAERAVVATCQVARTNGIPADVWCHVLGFLSGFDFLKPVLWRTFSLPETYPQEYMEATLVADELEDSEEDYWDY
jgi:hypothetical protein